MKNVPTLEDGTLNSVREPSWHSAYFSRTYSVVTLLQQMEGGLTLPRGARLTHTLQSPWEIASQWVGPREVYPEETPELADVLTALSTARIERADVGYKGTQLKALLVLDGGQKVVFKPKRSDFLKSGLNS